MKSGDNRITIELPKGLKLVAEQNIDPEYQNEIYVGIETPDGIWHQDLVVIRNAYSMRLKKSTTQKATFSLLSSKEKAGRDCPALLLLKQIVRQFQLEPHQDFSVALYGAATIR